MQRCVALLRGVNVGGRNRLAMADLRSALAAIGCVDVATILQSGNAAFSTAGDPEEVGRRLGDALAVLLGRPIGVVVRDATYVIAVVAANPLLAEVEEPDRLGVTFLSGPPNAAVLAGLDARAFHPDRFAAGDRVIYTYTPTRGEVRLPEWGRLFGQTVTARNWATVNRVLVALRGEVGA